MTPDRAAAPLVAIRSAEPGDATAVAALHAASWRAHYRGALSDAYLDGPIEDERLAVWTGRLGRPEANQGVLLAVADGTLLGFVCFFVGHDARRGSLIDNLHVMVGRKRHGIGRQLMRAAGGAIGAALPDRPAYLYVLEANTAAQDFYDRIGGIVVERTRHVEPDGSDNPVLRYAWATPAALVDAAAGQAAVRNTPRDTDARGGALGR